MTARNILVYRLGSLGDTIVALPCFHLLRRSFPGARFTLLTNRPVASKAAAVEAVLGSTYFQEVLDYPVGLRHPGKLLSLLGALRVRRFDTVIHLAAARGRKEAIRDAWFFRAAGVRQIIGLPGSADHAPMVDPVTGHFESEFRRLARRLTLLGDARVEADASWDLALTIQEIRRAEDLLAREEQGQLIVALSCGTKWRTNDWEAANWEALARALRGHYPGYLLVLLGAAEERDRNERLAAAWGGPVRNLCGRTSPRESAAILREASFFVGHDSGPLHLAACVGTPCVGIFSARNPPGRWFPRGERTRVIYHQPECFGCGLEQCDAEGKKCILSIGVDEVLEAIRSVRGATASA